MNQLRGCRAALIPLGNLPRRSWAVGMMMFHLPGPHSTFRVLAKTASSAVFSPLSLLVIGRVIGPRELAGRGEARAAGAA